MHNKSSTPGRRGERGVTMLIVLAMLSVMLLGGLALARLTEVGTLASGNAGFHESAMQASEVGVNTAFAAVKALVSEDTAVNGWYWPTAQAKDASGLPSGVNWDSAPKVTIGKLTVQYVAERACNATPVSNVTRQCLIRQTPDPTSSRVAGAEQLDPPNSRQFRITVLVTGPKGSKAWVQSLVTKG